MGISKGFNFEWIWYLAVDQGITITANDYGINRYAFFCEAGVFLPVTSTVFWEMIMLTAVNEMDGSVTAIKIMLRKDIPSFVRVVPSFVRNSFTTIRCNHVAREKFASLVLQISLVVPSKYLVVMRAASRKTENIGRSFETAPHKDATR